MHQCRDQSFELRVVTATALPVGFSERIHAAWSQTYDTDEATLRIVELDQIAPGRGGKIQDFTSDLMSDDESDAALTSRLE